MADLNQSVIAAIKPIEQAIVNAPEPVPVAHGRELVGPTQYRHRKVPPLQEKAITARYIAGDQGAEIQVPVTHEDAQRLKEKAQLAQLWDFDKWVCTVFLKDLNAPERKAWLRKHYPEFFDRQIEMMNTLNNQKARYEKLKINGPKSKEDMWFMYTYERDWDLFFNEVRGMMHQMLGMEAGAEAESLRPRILTETAFQRGVWNTHRLFNEWAAQIALPYKTIGDFSRAEWLRTYGIAPASGVTRAAFERMRRVEQVPGIPPGGLHAHSGILGSFDGDMRAALIKKEG